MELRSHKLCFIFKLKLPMATRTPVAKLLWVFATTCWMYWFIHKIWITFQVMFRVSLCVYLFIYICRLCTGNAWVWINNGEAFPFLLLLLLFVKKKKSGQPDRLCGISWWWGRVSVCTCHFFSGKLQLCATPQRDPHSKVDFICKSQLFSSCSILIGLPAVIKKTLFYS